MFGLASKYYAYVHFKPDGTPFYIGKGSKNRAYDLIRNRNLHYLNIVAKHGAENILVEIYSCESEEEAFLKEIDLIKSMRQLGFNVSNKTNGGEGPSGMIHTAESRNKMSVARKGRTFTDEHRRKISESLTGRKRPPFSQEWRDKLAEKSSQHRHSAEALLKISESQKGNKHALGLIRGPMSDETKAKLSAIRKGSIPWNKGLRK